MSYTLEQYIRWFSELSIDDVALVGGKNASLGEMYQNLTAEGVRVPNGFAMTATAYCYVLEHNDAWVRKKKRWFLPAHSTLTILLWNTLRILKPAAKKENTFLYHR